VITIETGEPTQLVVAGPVGVMTYVAVIALLELFVNDSVIVKVDASVADPALP
jgi:hypothetical protein